MLFLDLYHCELELVVELGGDLVINHYHHEFVVVNLDINYIIVLIFVILGFFVQN